MDPVVQKKITRLIIIVVSLAVIPLIIYGAFYLITHGTVRINTTLSVVKVEAYKKPHLAKQDFSGTSFNVESGDYIIKAYFDGNQSYSKEITVGNFLATTTISPTLSSSPYTKILNSVNANILPLTNGNHLLFSEGRTSFTYTSQGSVIGFQQSISDAYYTQQGTLLMSSSSTTETSYYYYDTQTNQPALIAKLPANIAELHYHGADGFYSLSGGTLRTVSPSGVSSVIVPETIQYSLNSSTPIFSKNASHAAFFKGNDYYLGDLAGDDRPIDDYDPLQEANINIYLLSSLAAGQKYASIPLEKTREVSGILLSPSSKRLAIVYDKYLSIYDIESGEKTMSVMSSTDIDNTFWIDDDSLVFMDNSFNIYRANAPEREAYSVLAQNTLRVSTTCGLKGERLYFTAFDASSSQSQSSPSAYYLDLAE